MNYYVTDNTGASVALNDIPEVSYAAFYEDLRVKLSDARYHAAHYFALPSDRKSTRLNSSHWNKSRMPSSA